MRRFREGPAWVMGLKTRNLMSDTGRAMSHAGLRSKFSELLGMCVEEAGRQRFVPTNPVSVLMIRILQHIGQLKI